MNYNGLKRKNLKYILKDLYNEIIFEEDESTAVGIILYHEESNTIDFKYFIENNKWLKRFIKQLDESEGLAKKCITTKETLLIDDYYTQWKDYTKKAVFDGEPMRSVYCTPIIIEGRVKAVFTVQNKLPGIFKGRVLRKVELIKKVLESFFYEDMERELLEESKSEIEDLLNQLSIVKEVGEAVVSTDSLNSIAKRVYEIMKRNYSDCAIGIAINDRLNNKVKNAFLHELGESLKIKELDYSSDNSLMVRTILSGKEIVEENLLPSDSLVLSGNYPEAVYCTPLKMGDDIIGCFTYQIFHTTTFTESELQLCRQIAPFMTIAVNNSLEKKKLIEANNILRNYSERDHLTGLYNRRHFYEIFDHKCSFASTTDIYLLLLDFDNFKGINDNYGHTTGDRALIKISDILKDEIPDEYVARYGGDEFIAGFKGLSEKIVLETGERIRQRIEALSIPVDTSGRILTASIGILKTIPSKPLRDSFNDVDRLLYDAKRSGKNKITYKKN